MVITLQEESCDSLIQFYLVQIHLSLNYFDSRFLCRKGVLRITWSYLEKTMQANQFQTANSQLETLCWHCCSFSPFYYDDFMFSEILPSLKLLKSDCWCLLKICFLQSLFKSEIRVDSYWITEQKTLCWMPMPLQCHCSLLFMYWTLLCPLKI